MNDKEKILMDYARMCKKCDTLCIGCEILDKIDEGDERDNRTCQNWIMNNAKEAVEIIEWWAKEHPTRQDLFLEQYPDANIDRDSGIINIRPCHMDNKHYRTALYGCERDESCFKCAKKYWSEEVVK